MSRSINRLLQRVRILPALVLLCSFVNVHASTVLQMSFGEVIDKSELVFEGRVTNLESRRIQDGSIHTFVSFQIIELVKGQFASDTIELRFLGGEVDGRGLQVSDMQMPERGETGIYFVESLREFQVNPFVGWAQGHYLIEEIGNGDKIVTTASHDPVVSVEATEKAAMTIQQPSFSKGVASGVSVRRGIVSAATIGISVDQFKASVREIVEQAQ